MGKGAKSHPSKTVQALGRKARAVPDGFIKACSKEPSTVKQKERNATLLGLRMVGAPAVAFLKGVQIEQLVLFEKSYN